MSWEVPKFVSMRARPIDMIISRQSKLSIVCAIMLGSRMLSFSLIPVSPYIKWHRPSKEPIKNHLTQSNRRRCSLFLQKKLCVSQCCWKASCTLQIQTQQHCKSHCVFNSIAPGWLDGSWRFSTLQLTTIVNIIKLKNKRKMINFKFKNVTWKVNCLK